jgi:hypothetical protein
VTIAGPVQKALLQESQRFKFYGSQGCRYSVADAVLVDGLRKNESDLHN